MSVPYTRAPHQGGLMMGGADSPHAALLIDFDNVTMGMRSDLSKELKHLLDSDVIKGKVSVQRAYADWRRYPQYIVPLSEASVDLIFAPAYGSNKKNATDIRMAIDALELIFIRPEIGTFILLTGDSDFSSLVLKLKEYGKYVIGVGIQESSSDILVQNCDEYYSYTSLTGLTKTTELGASGSDPWVLVKDAVDKMVSRNDVMRSDRLKQVMQEIDPSFDEGSLGFSKFSKFLTEASSRGVVKLRKLENGQYEVEATRGGGSRSRRAASEEGRGRRERSGRGARRERRGRETAVEMGAPAEEAAPTATPAERVGDPLQDAYAALTEALEELRDAGRHPVRDSDVKRKMLESDPSFDEAELGFPKFSRFLGQAEDHGIVRLQRTEGGNLEVSLPDGTETAAPTREPVAEAVDEPAEPDREPSARFEPDPQPEVRTGPTVIDVAPPENGGRTQRLGPRGGSTRRRGGEEPPPLLEGQVAATPAASRQPSGLADGAGEPAGETTAGRGLEGLGLPTDPGAIVRYLTHRYKGVGEKTAQALVEQFGTELFSTMHNDPDAIARTVPAGRAEQVLAAWEADYQRRTGQGSGGDGANGGNGRRGRGRGRGRS